MATQQRVIGAPVGRTDGPDKTTGRGKYALDVVLPGTLWLKILRSPYPHARVKHIDTKRALAHPGIHAVLTPDEVGGLRSGKALQDEPLLAFDAVRYIGDKVAVVAADDEDTAEEALALIDVEYEELPAAVTFEQALADGAPILHPDFNSYQGLPGDPLERPTNAFARQLWEKGDLAEGFADADLILERSYTTPRSHQAYIEPHNCTVWIDDDDQIQIWMGSTAVFRSKNQLAALFGVPAEKITINRAYVGGEFGGKADFADSPLVYLMARKTGRPVKLNYEYTEELTASNPRHESSIRIKAGVKRDGTLTAWDAEMFFNSGAYAAYKPVPGSNLPGASQIGGPYKTPNVRMESIQVYTNTVPCGFARSPGEVQAIFSGETHMDLIAEELGMDRIELRLLNMMHTGDLTPAGLKYEDIRAEEVLREAVRASGWYEPLAPNTGRGLAIGNRSQIGGETHVGLAVHPDGRVTASSSIYDPGMGTDTMIQQVVAEEMNIPTSRIEMVPYNTDDVPFDTGIGGTRGSYVAPEAAHQASEDLQSSLRQLVAELEGWDEDSTAYEAGELVNEQTGARVAMETLSARTGEPVKGRGHVLDMNPSKYTSFVAQVAEVHVDPDSGEIEVKRITAVHDSARVINPIGYHGQVQGGMMNGFGNALTEDLTVDESGRVTTPTFAEFKIPSERDIPELTISLIEHSEGRGRYGTKGVGEHSNITTAGAIANAVAAASGVRVYSLPVTAEKVWRALNAGTD